MAGGAILGNAGAVLCRVPAVVTAEAAGITHVADMVGVRAPGHFHEREDVLAVNGRQFSAGSFDLGGFGGRDARILRAVKGAEQLRNLHTGLFLRGVVAVEQLQALLVDPGQIGADGSLGHGAIHGVFRGHKGVRRAVVAVNAVHHAPLALGNAAAGGQGREHRLRAVGVALLHPGDGGAALVRSHVLNVAQVGAVNAAQLRERILSTQMKDDNGLGQRILFVVGKARLDQQLFSHKAGRRVAALADFARRAQVPHRRFDRPGIVIERNLDQLFGAVHLGLEVRLCAGADVAGDAIHMGVQAVMFILHRLA